MAIKVLVTGGAGYIGSHVVKKLGELGYEIMVYDNLSTGNPQSVLYGELVVADLEDIESLRDSFNRFKPDAVMHFAAHLDVGESVQEPLKYYINNTQNTINLLRVMMEYQVKNFIFSSTCAVYGNPAKIPVNEEESLQPISPYGHSKRFIEQILSDLDGKEGFRYVTLRYFNVAGADPDNILGQRNENSTHLITRILKVLNGKYDNLEIYGTNYSTPDGTCIRDYIHVSDLASAHVKALEYLIENKTSDVFNLGYGRGYSVLDVISVSEEVTGKKIPVVIAERREGDIDKVIADNQKAINKLNWKPEFDSLSDIIKTAWNWEKKLASD